MLNIGGANLVGCFSYVGDGYAGRKISGDGGINYRADVRDRSLSDAAKPEKGKRIWFCDSAW